MSTTFFTSDSHFFHKNILVYEAVYRPFATLEEMHEVLIDNWNRVVGKYDKVYHLGDFAFGKGNVQIAGRLQGQKRLVMGNHDNYTPAEYLQYFKSIHGVLFWNDCILTHVPVHESNLEHRSKYNLHGHTHSKIIADPCYINVSVERWGLTPVSADELFGK